MIQKYEELANEMIYTFDMRDAQKAQPFGHPLDGRVRRLLEKHGER
jgi:hypothetical protein